MLGVDGLTLLNQPFKKLVASVNFLPAIAQWLGTPGFAGERHASCERQGVTVDLLFKSTTVRLGHGMHNGATAPGAANPNGPAFKIIAISDITQFLTTQRLVNSESYRRQWQALNAGVVISDARAPDMPIVYVNPMFEKISGYASREVLGRNCRILQGPETDQPGLVNIHNAIRNHTNGYAKLRNYRKDGSVFVNQLFISPVKDETNTVTHFVGIQHLEADQDLTSSL